MARTVAVTVRYTPVRDKETGVASVTSVAVDVPRHRRAEDALMRPSGWRRWAPGRRHAHEINPLTTCASTWAG
jgi:hypothetical protein